ncbi:HAMP domain-containing sensor histidine kinase [Conexibacter sp. DBS9H8]|uniref:HAMP domain-containing sensor histidine kinase n=1 Tax=Conexibacter sp. DBS9H8 TaxID=2937801 RepID=UPI00200DF651|nr:HAMP domain-containing sensor histidine kinase [Conexibacter sp. DBS9H8]
MTRRVALTGVLAVCVTALLVGGLAYVLVSRDSRSYQDRLLISLAFHPRGLLSPKATYVDFGQLTTPRDTVRYQTAALASLGRLPLLPPGFRTLTVGGRTLRTFTRVLPRGSVLSVGVSDAAVRASLARLRRGVLIAMGAGALLASLLLVWITRRALAPVRETATLADRIVSTGDLSGRVPERAGDDEIASLTRSLNRMLGHLESSDAALRRLVADASHELRSPVTTLVGNLELLAEAPMSDSDRSEALADTRAEAGRLARLVEALLSLARADTVTARTPVHLPTLLEDAVRGTSARLAPVPPECTQARVEGDEIALAALVRNLVENAERYGGGGAEVTLDADREGWQITVADHGPGIPVAEREAIFDRFRRGSRAAGTPGSGLGLAIAAASARAHGGHVRIVDTPGGGATFRVTLPRG